MAFLKNVPMRRDQRTLFLASRKEGFRRLQQSDGMRELGLASACFLKRTSSSYYEPAVV